jgi:phosphate transport system permease protein
MEMQGYVRRKIVDVVARWGSLAMVIVAIIPLIAVLGYLTMKGIGGISWSFFTELPKPVGEPGGGMANALTGSAIMIGLGCLIGVPVGLMGGIFLAEFGENSFAKGVRFCTDVMSGVPSIIVGIFVYGLMVLSMRRFSALAGGVALAILMLPVIMRTTEELLRLVPVTLREGGLALGLPKWRVILGVVLRTGASGIATGVMLAVSRAAGETAPLLFTAFGSRFISLKLDQPMGSLPVQIYTYAVSPYEDWHNQAWAAALVLVMLVLVLNLLARVLTRKHSAGGGH